MLKIFLDWVQSRQPSSCDQANWRQDPLAHPAISRMSPYELADLVVPPEATPPVSRSVKRSAAIAVRPASISRELPTVSACC
ncbi:hypothetical protein [Rhizobium sp. RU36D]|uniref:hypothetical protein n=1 Tax=Rhizobium sp. RU36D TaxID=1907415 RepID=UPI0009D89E73|nr:hypothetical protein [Rhizobium sp. RU36D]SMD04558.1 hypothetical protein SAMN05880593_11785 [Rhizobium sp. RU36D]